MDELVLKTLKLVALVAFFWGMVPLIIKGDKIINKVIRLGNYKEATLIETFYLTGGIFMGWLIAL